MANMNREFSENRAEHERYYRRLFETCAMHEEIPILCVATENYIFDFLVFYHSVVDCWRFFPFKLVVCSPEKETCAKIDSFELAHVETRHVCGNSNESSWNVGAALKIKLVEHSGIQRGIVSDVDNLFLCETPEMYLLLDNYDYVFVGAPHAHQPIQTSIWAFKRTPKSVKFSREWHRQSAGRKFSDASGLPYALAEYLKDDELPFRFLGRGRDIASADHDICPYDVQANVRPFELQRDALGLLERQMGRAKVLHLGGLRNTGNQSVAARMEVLFHLFPETYEIYPTYMRYANSAARRLGLPTIDNPLKYLAERLDYRSLAEDSILRMRLREEIHKLERRAQRPACPRNRPALIPQPLRKGIRLVVQPILGVARRLRRVLMPWESVHGRAAHQLLAKLRRSRIERSVRRANQTAYAGQSNRRSAASE